MNLTQHNVTAHYGVRDERYKLIYFYGKGLGANNASEMETRPYWELYDLKTDEDELHNVYDDPELCRCANRTARRVGSVNSKVWRHARALNFRQDEQDLRD